MTKLKFWKKFCMLPCPLPPGVQNSPFWPKNQYFSKYLKNASLDFFHIWHDLEPDKGLKLRNVLYFWKFLFAGGKGQRSNFCPIWLYLLWFDHILSYLHLIFLIFCINDIYHKWFRLMYKFHNLYPYWAWFSRSKGQIFSGICLDLAIS